MKPFLLVALLLSGCASSGMRVESDIPGVAGAVANFVAPPTLQCGAGQVGTVASQATHINGREKFEVRASCSKQ